MFLAAQCYSKAKQALHSSIPERLLCRDKEIDKIQNFLEKHLIAKKAGSLYISGAPGTGKTACLRCILNELQVCLHSSWLGFMKTQLVWHPPHCFNITVPIEDILIIPL